VYALFARLERYVFPALVALALWAAVLVAVPAMAQAQVAQAQVAQAQEKATSNEAGAPAATERHVVVVDPGDTLWSISSKKLGPDAAPWRVARGVERIYALNRERIGPDPDLVLQGQRLVLPDRLVRPATAERSARSARFATGAAPRATPTRKTAAPAEAGPKGQLAKSTTREAPRKTLGSAAAKRGGSPKPVAESASLPDVAAAPMPAARPLASDDPAPSPANSFLRTVRSAADAVGTAVAGFFAEFRADGRRMLGLGIMLGTLVVAALMAWKLPMRRTLRGDAERWGIPTGYYTSEATRHIAPFAYYPGSLGGRDSQYILRTTVRTEASEEATSGNTDIGTPNGTASAVSRIRKAWGAASRGRTRKARRARAVPRSGLALGVHNPDVRRASRQARARMRARNLRPQRGIARRPGSLAAAD
jgi:hypothetical protein